MEWEKISLRLWWKLEGTPAVLNRVWEISVYQMLLSLTKYYLSVSELQRIFNAFNAEDRNKNVAGGTMGTENRGVFFGGNLYEILFLVVSYLLQTCVVWSRAVPLIRLLSSGHVIEQLVMTLWQFIWTDTICSIFTTFVQRWVNHTPPPTQPPSRLHLLEDVWTWTTHHHHHLQIKNLDLARKVKIKHISWLPTLGRSCISWAHLQSHYRITSVTVSTDICSSGKGWWTVKEGWVVVGLAWTRMERWRLCNCFLPDSLTETSCQVFTLTSSHPQLGCISTVSNFHPSLRFLP